MVEGEQKVITNLQEPLPRAPRAETHGHPENPGVALLAPRWQCPGPNFMSQYNQFWDSYWLDSVSAGFSPRYGSLGS